MKPKTRKALKESIKKWEANVEAENPDDVLMGARDCPLCKLFWEKECDGCPVKQSTGVAGCENSPYETASDRFEDWQNGVGSYESWQLAAQDEVDFLKSLLPKKGVT